MGVLLCKNLSATFPACLNAACGVHPGPGCPSSALERNDCGLRIWVAGTTCVEFSGRGKHAKTAGASMRPFKVWTSLVRRFRPDIVVHEITPQAKAREILVTGLEDLYSIHTIRTSPVDLGYPCERPRQLSICLLRDHVVWHGKGDGEFFKIFAARVVLPASALWSAPRDYQQSVMRDKAKAQGSYFEVGQHVPLRECLTPFGWARHLAYKGRQSEIGAADGSYFYDVEQSPAYGSHSCFIPTLCGHGTLVNAATEEIAGGHQWLAFMGDPVFDHQREGHPYTCVSQSLVNSGSIKDWLWKDLAGNAIHEPTLGMVLLFALCQTSRTVPPDIDRFPATTVEDGRTDGDGEDIEAQHGV